MKFTTLAGLAVVGLMALLAGCQQPAVEIPGPILSVEMLRSRHEQAEFTGQVKTPMLLISAYPRADAAQMHILEHIWVDQKGHVLKEWITPQGVANKEEQLSSGQLPAVRSAITHLPGDVPGVQDRDLLLVSFRDGLGPWTTRTYSKKNMPVEMLPIVMAVAKEGIE